MLKALRCMDGAVAKLERAVAISAMAGLVGILVAQVFFRYVLLAPLFFAEEVALLLLVVATFAGLSLLVYERRLVTVDVLAQWLGPRGTRRLAQAIDFTVLVLAAAMAVVAFRYVFTPYVWFERSTTLAMPRAVMQVFFLVEMVFLTFHQAVEVVHPRPRPIDPGASA